MPLNLAKVGAPEGRRRRNLFTEAEIKDLLDAYEKGYSNKQIFDGFEANNGRLSSPAHLGAYIAAQRKRRETQKVKAAEAKVAAKK